MGRASPLIIVGVIKGYKPSKLTRSIGNMMEMVLVPLAMMMMDDDDDNMIFPPVIFPPGGNMSS